MTQRDMAGFLGISTATIRNWRKNKPNLYKIIMQGFAFEEAVDRARQNYESLKEVQDKVKR